ncbi:transcription termination factor MTERF15, mitochondrial [Typha angustifolia]|uniref:transcription termination factor MTERF15, mitochondrial n=1 Tax=Typha angustifolia TaxID=59011 RepID=UPI003C2C7DE2
MAIRALGRRLSHCIPPEFREISSRPLRNFRSFSKYPRLSGTSPSTSLFSRQVAIAAILQRYGFAQSHLLEFIQKNNFLLDSNPSDAEKCIEILLSLGFSPNSLVSTLCSCPSVLDPKFLREWQIVFMELGLVPPYVIQKVLEQSGRFAIKPEDIRRNVLFMKNMGFRDETLVSVVKELPLIFLKDSSDIGGKIDMLRGIGLKLDEIDRICRRFPGYFALSVEGRLRLLFEEFRELGFTRNEVRTVLHDDPRLLLNMEVGELSRCVGLMNGLKCRQPIKEKILSRGHLRAAMDVKLRVDCLCRHGLIHRDAFKVLFKEPRVIIYDLEDIEKKIEFLLHKIKFGIAYLVDYPKYLGVNLQKHIIPRYDVIEYLVSIGGLGDEVGMDHIVKLSRLKFYNLFVKPYPECEKIFGGLVRQKEVKSRHPTGMWKLFKPQKFAGSKEDVKNMRLFMESLA